MQINFNPVTEPAEFVAEIARDLNIDELKCLASAMNAAVSSHSRGITASRITVGRKEKLFYCQNVT